MSRTLGQLAEAVAWDRSLDWLSKKLRELKARGWIDYDSQPGKKRHIYAIRLCYDRPDSSEENPRTQALNAAEAGAPNPRTTPSTGSITPSTEPAASPLQDLESAAANLERLRAPRDVREKTTSLIEDQVLGEGLDQDKVVGEVRGEDRFLAALEAIEPVEVPSPARDALDRLRELVAPTRLDELLGIAARPPATEQAIFAEVEELVVAGVLIEREP